MSTLANLSAINALLILLLYHPMSQLSLWSITHQTIYDGEVARTILRNKKIKWSSEEVYVSKKQEAKKMKEEHVPKNRRVLWVVLRKNRRHRGKWMGTAKKTYCSLSATLQQELIKKHRTLTKKHKPLSNIHEGQLTADQSCIQLDHGVHMRGRHLAGQYSFAACRLVAGPRTKLFQATAAPCPRVVHVPSR